MRPRLIFMDLEGTLLRKAIHLDNQKVAPSAWTLLAEALGPDALHEEEESKDRWLSGGYENYLAWMIDTIRIFQRHALSEKLFRQVIDSVDIVGGACEAGEEFRRWGTRTALVSGGFKALAEKVQIALRIDHSLSACEFYFNEVGGLAHWNLLPTDYEGKVDFMRLLMREYGYRAESCVFVGDGKNDVPLAREVGLSVAFNAQPELKAVATYSIEQADGREDFREVARIIGDHT